MSLQLIADAVVNARADQDITFWDRLFAVWFRRLVYTQIWEDPEADLAALRPNPGASFLTISSGGCNALSYLTADPARVYAVDLNDAHLALLQLKLAGLKSLPTYQEFYRFFGAANTEENDQTYRAVLRPVLDPAARAFWDGRDRLGRYRYRYFTKGFYRYGMLGQFIGAAHAAASLFGIDLASLLEPPTSARRQETLRRVDRFFQSRLFRAAVRTPALLFSLGIPPRQRDLLAGPDGRLDRVLQDRFLRLGTGFPADENYFAWQALARRYPGPGDSCLPPYLQDRHHATMRARASRVAPVQGNLRHLIEQMPARSIDHFVLLDSQDWMADREIDALWSAIDRVATDGASVIFRTAGVDSPLDALAFAAQRDRWARDPEASAIGLNLDRSGIYGGFHLYRRR